MKLSANPFNPHKIYKSCHWSIGIVTNLYWSKIKDEKEKRLQELYQKIFFWTPQRHIHDNFNVTNRTTNMFHVPHLSGFQALSFSCFSNIYASWATCSSHFNRLNFEWNRQVIYLEDFFEVLSKHFNLRFLVDCELNENDDVSWKSFHNLLKGNIQIEILIEQENL